MISTLTIPRPPAPAALALTSGMIMAKKPKKPGKRGC